MRFAGTVIRKIEKVRDRINREGGVQLRTTDIEDIASKYFGTLKRVMAKGNHNVTNSFVNRMEVPSIGHIEFNNSVVRRALEKDIIKDVDIEWAYECYAYVRHHGWKYFDWNQGLGYIYLHEETGSFYTLKHDNIKGVLDAHTYFSEVVDSPYVWHNIPVNFEESFEMIQPLTSKGFIQYSKEGTLIRKYDTLAEASEENNLTARTVLWAALRNKEKYPNTMLLIKGSFWVFDERYDPTRFRSLGTKVIHAELIDILDADTGDVLFKSFGTASDIAKYIRSLRKYSNVKTGPILRVLNTNKRMYGYKYQRSIP